MPARNRLAFTMLCLSLFLIPALQLVRELSRRSDIWWTPQTMLVPLAQSADRVEIYVGGTPLATLLERGQVRVGGETGSAVLAADQVGLRFNNWDRVRAERIPRLLLYAAGCGITGVLALMVATGRLAYRGETAP